eukprot:674013-Ditylum_brightwellii.AAC.1
MKEVVRGGSSGANKEEKGKVSFECVPMDDNDSNNDDSKTTAMRKQNCDIAYVPSNFSILEEMAHKSKFD